MRRSRIHFSILVILAGLAGLASGASLRAQQYDESLFKGMKWRSIGPFRGGRVLAVTGIPGDPRTFYFGAVAGGVWKTIDGGVSWEPMTDKNPISSIGAIAVAESDPNVIYVGTGESCIRGNITHGDGVYKSLDAGKTWTNAGLRDTLHIAKVIVHPRNPDIVLVAALGHAYGPNQERGVFRSTDGGKTWEKVLYKDDKTGAIDITFDPTNPHILYAALWEAYRTPYSLSSGGPGSGLYKSLDGGASWKRLEGNGLPAGILGRIGVAVSGADPNRVYAQIEAEEGGLYRSDDGGEKWTKINDDHRFRQRAWYFTHIFADPKNVDTVYELNTGLLRSTDGGHSFTMLPAPHGDHHALWIDPTDPSRMINGNDGGATITVDGGKTWSAQSNQPTAQFYHVIADNRFPYHVYGSQQDNSSVAIASRSDSGVIDRPDWYPVGGGEAGFIAPYPPDPDIVYAGDYEGLITRFDRRNHQEQVISPWPLVTDGEGAARLKYRFQWTAPIVISPHDPNVLYHAAQVLLKSTDAGMSWTAISPDLTRNDKSKQQVSGGPITHDDTGTEFYDTIFAVAESPLEKGLIWTGSDDGLVHLTRDGGKTWTDVTPHSLLEWSRVSLIEPSPRDAGAAYLAANRYQLDDFRPYIYKTDDFGKTWTQITSGIPENAYVRAVREDPKQKGLLYAGTEAGVFVSFNDGGHWQPLRLNLPQTPIHDLVVKDDDLVVATHGRSFWILDDFSPLRQLNAHTAKSDAFLFVPRPAYRLRGPEEVRKGAPVGENPPAGAIIYYYLKTKPKEKEEVTLEILDNQGKLIRKYSNLEKKETEEPEEWPDQVKQPTRLPGETGMNRFAWDLRYERPTLVPGAIYAGAKPRGPLVVPGAYQVKLAAAGASQTVPIEIKPDPRVKTTKAEYATQLDLALRIRQSVSEAHETVIQIRDLRAQLKELRKRLGDNAKFKTIAEAADQLDKNLTAAENELIQVNRKSSEDSLHYPVKLNEKLIALDSAVEHSDTAPTQQSYDVFKLLRQELDAQLMKWREIQATSLAGLNNLMREQQIPGVSISPPASGAAAAAP